MLLATMGRFREARPLLEESFNFEHLVSGDLYHQLGLCYFDARELERAKEAFLEALKRGLDDTWATTAHHELGKIYMRKGAFARAIEEFKLAEAHADASNTPKKYIYDGLAKSFRKLGMNDEAAHYADLAK